jgi:hypothetical protein
MLNILSLLLAVSQRCTSYLNPPFSEFDTYENTIGRCAGCKKSNAEHYTHHTKVPQ